MAHYNACEWLVVHKLENCGNRCRGRLCGVHLAQLRKKPGTEPRPCRVCGRGTKSKSQLCGKVCGQDRVQKALRWAETRAKRLFPGVMNELLHMAQVQRMPAFVGLSH